MTKYALVIGIDYDGELPGCLTDANDMEVALKKQGYIVTKLLGRQCTARRLIQNFAYMCYYSYFGRYRELFIHYSGHGTRVRDRNGDELDGYDEAMVSYDKYAISDDTFVRYLQWLPRWTNVKILMDCCHSGTSMDLQYRWHPDINRYFTNYKCRCAANIQMISGCQDDQVSAEVSMNGTPRGVMTTMFLKHVDDTFQFTKSLVKAMTESIVSMKMNQRPLFSSSRRI